ncbi:MAG: tRNA (adenosine(37)-N6)-threonylcarbamoyltransferase complex transferase subunit TsaD [Candidatus Omnitrophota bacterium]
MFVLGIESSCDETCAAVSDGRSAILSNIVASSLPQHVPHGGVIPEIASRHHLESICFVVDEALKKSKIKPKDLDAIAVTQGPGLIGSLLVGISFARALGMGWKLPVVGVNHVRAHLYAAFIGQKITFPFVGLAVSGGHTSLYEVRSLDDQILLGATRDDAAGEAFDKVAKILGLGYPGGPVVERWACQGRPRTFDFRCDCGPGLDFSFSGIKTAVLYKVQSLKKIYGRLSRTMVADLCASFQEAVVSDLVAKAMRAATATSSKILVVGGGVAFNNYLRERLQSATRQHRIKLLMAAKPYCLDNAAMVASLGSRLIRARSHMAVLNLDALGPKGG